MERSAGIQAPALPVRKLRLCVVGEKAVGKSALIARFSRGTFHPEYATTVGARWTRSRVAFDRPPLPEALSLDLHLGDLPGAKAGRPGLLAASLHGADGVLAVADLTRYDSLLELHLWIEAVRSRADAAPILLAVNKVDLARQGLMKRAEVEEFAAAFHLRYLYTSARTGFNVREAFERLAEAVLVPRESSGPPRTAGPKPPITELGMRPRPRYGQKAAGSRHDHGH